MSLFTYKYENELFESSISKKKPPKKIEFSYVANSEVIPDSKISYNISKEKNSQEFYIFNFLNSEKV